MGVCTKTQSVIRRGFEHFEQDGVDGRVTDEFEEKQVLQALEADGPQGGQAEKELGKTAGFARVVEPDVLLQGEEHLLSECLDLLGRPQPFGLCEKKYERAVINSSKHRLQIWI